MARGEPALKAPKASPIDAAEERLVVEAAQKDPRRFAQLYEDNFERVYAFIIRRVRDRDNPGPVVEEATESGLDEVDRRARLFRMVEGLPADQRRVIMMRFSEEKSIREIAQKLQRTEGAVKQLQFRGLQSLRTSMGGVNG